MEQQTKDLQDYLFTIKKRKTGILVIAMSVLLVSAMVAMLLPPVYKSSSTILIEQQEIPQDLVMSTVTSYAAERIQVIEARVMSRANLMDIVDKYDLYVDERKRETTEEILARVSDDISLDVINAEVVDPRTGRPSSATIAFSLSFEGESPPQVQRVANELTSLYLNENLKNRTQKAEDTSTFFKRESERLSKRISELEDDMATFKQENADKLPELQALNMSMLQRKESEVAALDAKQLALEDKKFYLNGQLAQIDPGNPAIMGASTRLKIVEAEYLSLKAKYSPQHPDVIRLEQEMASLEDETSSDKGQLMADELTVLRGELAAAEKKYTADHPDVLALRDKVETLSVELKALQSRADDSFHEDQPDNPAYITLKAQLSSIDSEILSVEDRKKMLRDEITELERVIQLSPQIEKEYKTLTRDYNNALIEYKETQSKKARADVAKQLESEKKGERFSLIDPPALPEEPISPNRPAILFLGLVLSLGSGIGFALISDAVSGAVRGASNIRKVLGVSPLAVIPYQMNMADLSRRKAVRKRTLLVGVAVIIGAILMIHLFVSPLDVLWFRVLRKIDILTA